MFYKSIPIPFHRVTWRKMQLQLHPRRCKEPEDVWLYFDPKISVGDPLVHEIYHAASSSQSWKDKRPSV